MKNNHQLFLAKLITFISCFVLFIIVGFILFWNYLQYQKQVIKVQALNECAITNQVIIETHDDESGQLLSKSISPIEELYQKCAKNKGYLVQN